MPLGSGRRSKCGRGAPQAAEEGGLCEHGPLLAPYCHLNSRHALGADLYYFIKLNHNYVKIRQPWDVRQVEREVSAPSTGLLSLVPLFSHSAPGCGPALLFSEESTAPVQSDARSGPLPFAPSPPLGLRPLALPHPRALPVRLSSVSHLSGWGPFLPPPAPGDRPM